MKCDKFDQSHDGLRYWDVFLCVKLIALVVLMVCVRGPILLPTEAISDWIK